MPPLSVWLYEQNQELWQQYLEHPFITELAAGTLDQKKFRFYMIQDYFYLQEYLKIFALTLAKAEEPEEINYLTAGVNLLFQELNTVHKQYLRQLGVDTAALKAEPVALTTVSYTHYMKACAYEGTVLAGLMTLLSCSWSYAFIAKHLKKQIIPNRIPTFYTHWIETYAQADYQNANDRLIARIDTLSADLNQEEKNKLLTIFTICSEYELKFWEMSYNLTLK